MVSLLIGRFSFIIVAICAASLSGMQSLLDIEAGNESSLKVVSYDIVIRGGRVMDPESGLDAIRQVGISDGTIRAVRTAPMKGRVTIDATGLVVAPGIHRPGCLPAERSFLRARWRNNRT